MKIENSTQVGNNKVVKKFKVKLGDETKFQSLSISRSMKGMAQLQTRLVDPCSYLISF